MNPTNFGSYGDDGPEARLPPWCRAVRAALRVALVVLCVTAAGWLLFPLDSSTSGTSPATTKQTQNKP